MLTIEPTVRCVVSDKGAVLLDVSHGRYFSINPVGAVVFQQIELGQSPEAIAAYLATRYGISVEAAARDVTAFVQHLDAKGLVHDERTR